VLLGVYADPHFSLTSSILTGRSSNSKYTKRLDMLINTYEWMYEQFGKDVDVIAGLGDISDSYVMHAEEITALGECLSFSKGVPEWHVVGNHEKFHKNPGSNSMALLDRIDHITVFDEPAVVNDEVSVMPYQDTVDNDIFYKLSNKVLLSHLNIIGTYVGKRYRIEHGAKPEVLVENFDTVLNGHYHVYSEVKNVVNVGSVVGHSFGDNYLVRYPSIHVFDTNSCEIVKSLENPYAVLFVKFNAVDMDYVFDCINDLNDNRRYVVEITVPYELRDHVGAFMESNNSKVKNCIEAYRIKGKVKSYKDYVREDDVNMMNYSSGKEALIDYINKDDKPAVPKEDVIDFIKSNM